VSWGKGWKPASHRIVGVTLLRFFGREEYRFSVIRKKGEQAISGLVAATDKKTRAGRHHVPTRYPKIQGLREQAHGGTSNLAARKLKRQQLGGVGKLRGKKRGLVWEGAMLGNSIEAGGIEVEKMIKKPRDGIVRETPPIQIGVAIKT